MRGAEAVPPSESTVLSHSIVKLIDHAVLHPTQTDEDLRSACALCAELGVASVCVKPSYIPLAVELLSPSSTCASTVIGFPHGGAATAVKVAETRLACELGAREVDMVVNLGHVLAGSWDFVEQDIREVVEAARVHGVITKVIFECGLLPSDELKIRLCQVCQSAGAAFVKTSTGFGFVKDSGGGLLATGATEHDVRLMRAHCGPAVQVKASGGIRSYEDARRFVELGATRLGTSATREIAAGELGVAARSESNY